ncbi:MAG: VWA domain-containing protein [Terracidiphilus sp.]|jgi:VWFA-related protein
MRINHLLPVTFLVCLLTVAPATRAQDVGIAEGHATVQAQSTLVLIDVTATDGKHNPVHQLTPADFTILEDGKPQTLKVFEEHEAGPPAPFPPGPKLVPGTFTNYSPAPPRGALNILLFDKLNTPMNSQTYVRDQVLKYLKQAPPGTRMAIFSLTMNLKMLQGFTSDPELLRSLVAGKKVAADGSPLLNNQMDGDNPGSDDDMQMDAASLAPDAATVMANLQQFEAEQQSYQTQFRLQYTLDALNQLARYLSNLPGRKNLIWFSGSFPINILPDGNLQDPFMVTASAEDEYRQTVDLLSRGQVAVYPIDARGLMVTPMYSASQAGSNIRSPQAFANAQAKFSQKTSSEHDTMEQMAEQTGGKAYVDTNGLAEAVQNAIETGANYYTVAYSPTNQKWNGGFRKIVVKVNQPGVNLTYRRGYYADDPDKPVQNNKAQSAQGQKGQPAAAPYNSLSTAMMHGAPDPTQLVFVTAVRPSADNESAAVTGNQLGKDVHGPFRRYMVVFAIKPSQLNFTTEQDGSHHCGLEFVTFVYDANGDVINEQTNGMVTSIPDSKFADTMKRDFIYRQQISVPVKGEYYFRIGMRDRNSDNVGALEVPVESVPKQQPATAVPASGAATKQTGTKQN